MERFASTLRARFVLKPPTPVSWALIVISLLSFVRMSVSFLESWAICAHERRADVDLLKLCSDGAAASSEKFRLLCLKAHADRASPLLFKTLVHAVRGAWIDFCESFNSPTKILLLVLFCLSGLALPVVRLFTRLAEGHLTAPSQGYKVLSGMHGITFEDECGNGDLEFSTALVQHVDGRGRGMSFNRRKRMPSIRMINEDEDEVLESGHLHDA